MRIEIVKHEIFHFNKLKFDSRYDYILKEKDVIKLTVLEKKILIVLFNIKKKSNLFINDSDLLSEIKNIKIDDYGDFTGSIKQLRFKINLKLGKENFEYKTNKGWRLKEEGK